MSKVEFTMRWGADYALPAGYSEHNSGLSLDIGSGLTQMDRALEGKWIEKKCLEIRLYLTLSLG